VILKTGPGPGKGGEAPHCATLWHFRKTTPPDREKQVLRRAPEAAARAQGRRGGVEGGVVVIPTVPGLAPGVSIR